MRRRQKKNYRVITSVLKNNQINLKRRYTNKRKYKWRKPKIKKSPYRYKKKSIKNLNRTVIMMRYTNMKKIIK